MKLEQDTADHFIQYLKEHGYPENSIAVEYMVSPGVRVDIAVLDLEKNIPIQIFELKSKKNRESIEKGERQINRALMTLKNTDTPAYLVFPSEVEPFFEILSVERMNDPSIDATNVEILSMLDFHAQRNSRIAEMASSIVEEKRSEVDKFQWICWILALVTFSGLVSFKILSIEISATELSMFGGVVALILLPSSRKIKILGFEYERLVSDKRKERK